MDLGFSCEWQEQQPGAEQEEEELDCQKEVGKAGERGDGGGGNENQEHGRN